MTAVDVEKIAEAVLYEGYLLFPYRRSAMKNQQRWTFGGVYPRGYSEATGGGDPWLMQTQCLVLGDPNTEIDIKVRFLHVAERKVMAAGPGTPRAVEELRIGGQVYRPWEEAIEREALAGVPDRPCPLRLSDLLGEIRRYEVEVPAGSDIETLLDADHRVAGTLVREWRSIRGAIEVAAEPLEARPDQETSEDLDMPLYRLTIRIINATPWPAEERDAQSRADAVRQTLVSTHTILRVRDGEFVSLLEPPDGLQQAAGACENVKTWPVLVGEPGERRILLSSPIILYDYPQISPESQGNYFDATEIDELLALSVLTLTDEEKQEMRESDDHGRAILERTESLSEEQLLKMHGVVRYLNPSRRETR